MIDYVNTKLKVAEIRYENDCKCFAMEPVPNLHKERHVLYDGRGNKYHPDCTSLDSNKEGLTVYTFEFEDKDIDIPIGTELMFETEEWRKKLPGCSVKSIRYEQNTYSFPDARILYGLNLFIERGGEVSITTVRDSHQSYDRMVQFSADEAQIQFLFDSLLTCVSGNSCYRDQWMDDTGRSMIVSFENGEEYEFDNVFYNSEENTNVKYISDFLNTYKDRNEYIYTTIEPEKRWYQISLKDNEKENARKIIRQAKRLKLICFPAKCKKTLAFYAERYEKEELLSVLEPWDYDLDELTGDHSQS